MSKKNHLSEFRNLYFKFLELVPHDFEAMQFNFETPNAMTFEESKQCLNFVLEVLNGIDINKNWSELSLYAINNLETFLQRTLDKYIKLNELKDENSFHEFTNSLDFLAHFLRMAGVVGLATDSIYQEKTNLAISNELFDFNRVKLEVQSLQSEVKKLITPAIAGSLSSAFNSRKHVLLFGRVVWGIILLIVGYIAIKETHAFATSFNETLLEIHKRNQPVNFLWEFLILRSSILLPLYVAFGVAFSQYKKERDFEEQYAHKAAVAVSLPNYGDLTRDPAVRDQIVSAATNVIFSTTNNKRIETKASDKGLDSIKEVLASITKLLPRKD